MSNKAKIILISSIFLGAVFLFFFVFEMSYSNSTKKDLFVVKRGENVFQIATNLKSEGYIRSKIAFVYEAFFRGDYSKLKAGRYTFADGLGDRNIIQIMVKGIILPANVSVIPGWTIKNISQTLDFKGLVDRDALMGIMSGSKDDEALERLTIETDFDFLADKPEEAGLEGYLFPDTYQVEIGVSEDKIIRQMLSNFGEKLTPELKDDIKASGRSIFEVVTMASMLEKEVKTIEDKKMVAGILWKRSDAGMPLEVDSTLLYFLVSAHPSVNDKNSDSLYNTYKYGGLPVGPICNPGLESIMAAIYPEKSGYWYYLSAPDGKTVFSKSFGEHLINKAKYID